MAYPHYDIHWERVDQGDDAWLLVFHTETSVWMVEHVWRRREPRNMLVIAKERHTLEDFAASRTGKRLSAQYHAALVEAGLDPVLAARVLALATRLN